jgi:hypothetical protein
LSARIVPFPIAPVKTRVITKGKKRNDQTTRNDYTGVGIRARIEMDKKRGRYGFGWSRDINSTIVRQCQG